MKVLLVCEWIAPAQTIGAIRWTKISKYLKKCHGEKIIIDVLTNTKNNSYVSKPCPKDALLEKEMRYFDHYFAVPVDSRVIRLKNWYKKAVLKNKDCIHPEEKQNHSFGIYFKSSIRKAYQLYYS